VIVRVLPVTMTDDALVEALRAEVPGAADLFFDRYGPYVERLIVRVVGIDADVPDLIQEVFARAFEGVNRLRAGSALKGWIGSIAIFTARAFLRDRSVRRRRLSLGQEPVPEPVAPVADPEVTEALRRAYAALATLPDEERVVFALRFMDGMELAELATVCRYSLATVKRRLARAQASFAQAAAGDPLLRELMADFGEEKRT
jgi:RNA polymerase sigma-70 factor (ECF subfamily)